MNRKDFIQKTVGTMLIAIPAVVLVGCSSSDDGMSSQDPDPDTDPDGESTCTNGTNVAIGGNHGHTLTVSAAEVSSGTQRTYSIQGSSGHDHMITITAANFMTLQSNQSITVNSTNDDGHIHAVDVSCA